MRSAHLLAITALSLTACATSPSKPVNTSNWEDFGYEGMAAKINRLAGTGSINCGIHNHMEPEDPVNKILTPQESKACIKAAMKAGTPFRYGSIRIPTDSFLFDALVRSSTGELWTIKYDYMIDGSSNHHFIKRCKSASVDYSNLTYEGVDCQDVTAGEWLADIPEQPGQ